MTKERHQLYADMLPHHLTPLWEVLHSLVPPSPATPCLPAFWSYEAVRPYLARAGEVISAAEAVRRVLILENPALRGQSAITQSLYAGLQLILPGEVAPSHRHTQSALRFIVEGEGAYTAVNGERTTMHEGDFIITPSWTWHDHGNESDKPMVWLDGLDIPIIRFFDAGFAENGSSAAQAVTQTEGESFARFGHNMAPVRHDGLYASPYGRTSPLFSYPIARTLEALYTLERSATLDDWDGFKLAYTNPLSGQSPMPTIATFMQRLPKGFAGKPYKQTDGAVFSVCEGSGTATITGTQPGGGTSTAIFHFTHRDHFVVPSWHSLKLSSTEGCTLFSFSDKPIHLALGIHREERQTH
ncbi:MAG: gentisate 1,2-dioxygenase [Cytophagales bacterium]|nr:gentisate 1,2-dioxygenase [Cytophagales bacterium]